MSELFLVALVGLPALAGAVGLLLPLAWRRAASSVAIAGASCALVIAAAFTVHLFTTPREVSAHSPIVARFGDFNVDFTARLTDVSALLTFVVAAVAMAVQVYSITYLARDERYAPYAAQVSLFTAAMLLVVVTDDLVGLLVGWEVMGLCSYLLIGHDRDNPDAPRAALKAFLVTRVGDIGFLLGIVVLAVAAGSFRFADLAGADLPPSVLTPAFLLLLLGVAGKSAQFPLHTWLPDAMAGPTPVSALIHSATMVAAGVYVLVRFGWLLELTEPVRVAMALVGGVTLLFGACAALAQDDLKRVLAWSTISQLGYMVAGLSLTDGGAAVLFHLVTHAAFKALLFLCAGAVIHAVASNSLARMGGLRTAMPLTYVTMSVGLAALAGLVPFSGFWSKESLVALAYEQAHAATGAGRGWFVFVAMLVAVPITAFYAMRLWLRVFHGPALYDVPTHTAPSRVDLPDSPASSPTVPSPHDPTPGMAWPLVALAVPAAVLGVLGAWQPGAWWSGANERYDTDVLAPHHLATFALGVVLPVLGATLAWWLWRGHAHDPARVLGRARGFVASGFRFDTVQRVLVVRPAVAVARAVAVADSYGIDGTVEAAGREVRRIGRATERVHTGLGRYVTLGLAGVVVLAVGAALVGWLR